MTGHRTDRVADQLQRVLARLIQGELRDPRVGFVTLTGVRLSPDLKHARVFVTFLGSDAPVESLRALRRTLPFLRRALAREAGLKFVPELHFEVDEAQARGWRIEDILRGLDQEAATEVRQAEPAAGDPES